MKKSKVPITRKAKTESQNRALALTFEKNNVGVCKSSVREASSVAPNYQDLLKLKSGRPFGPSSDTHNTRATSEVGIKTEAPSFFLPSGRRHYTSFLVLTDTF